ncbi:phosphatidylinositol kinase, partial [Streptomyces sp. NPDC057674]
MPAPERIPPRSMSSSPPPPPDAELLAHGELTVRGRVREASNAVLYCSVAYEGREAACVYKPVAGGPPRGGVPHRTRPPPGGGGVEVDDATRGRRVPPP